MNWNELTKNKSQKLYLEFVNHYVDEATVDTSFLDKDYIELREDIMNISNKVLNSLQANKNDINRLAYEYDYRFGIELYELLIDKYDFNRYLASNDNIWIYIHVNVIPDLVYYRWKDSIDHVYKRSARLWLKQLWWYTFLAWENSKEDTIKILRDNNSDTIVQLVERTGKYGYRVELYKEILHQRSEFGIDVINAEVFRRIMAINTARVKVIDPYLYKGRNFTICV